MPVTDPLVLGMMEDEYLRWEFYRGQSRHPLPGFPFERTYWLAYKKGWNAKPSWRSPYRIPKKRRFFYQGRADAKRGMSRYDGISPAPTPTPKTKRAG